MLALISWALLYSFLFWPLWLLRFVVFVSWLLCSFGFVSLLLRCSQLYNSLGLAFTVLSLYIFLSIVFPLPYRFVATHFFLYPWARD